MVALPPRLLATVLVCTNGAAAGLIVHRDAAGFQFTTAVEMEINGKDRALILGLEVPAAASASRLQSFRLGATLIRDQTTGVVGAYTKGSPFKYLYPDGIPRNAAPAPREAWKQVRITFKRAQSDKAQSALAADEFVAYLAGDTEELAAICTDTEVLKLIGGDQPFDAQIALTAASVAAFGAHPAMAAVERYVSDSMRVRLGRFNRGIDSAASLDEGLRFSQLSAKSYPSLPGHIELRRKLSESKSWLDRKSAILHALAAGEQWDAFLLCYSDFEIHQSSFPSLMKLREKALQSSLDVHWAEGKQRMARGHYKRAFEQLRLASFRRPSDSSLQKELSIAWSEYSRQAAAAARQSRPVLTAGQRDALAQWLHFAARYREQNKLDDAMKSIAEAERIDPVSLPVLLAKAGILGARNEIAAALETLDVYDLHAVDEERNAGSKLRNDLLFQLTAGLGDLSKKSEAAWNAGRYHESLRLARQGLLANPRTPDLLYRAGAAALITRDSKSGKDFLARYLQTSNSIDADPKLRASVYGLLSSLEESAAPSSEGEPNWLSGVKLPPLTPYCPISLAFQPRIDRIAASNKLSLQFQYDGPRLKSIIPVFEKNAQPTGEKPVAFTYHPRIPHAVAVDHGDQARKLPDDPDLLLESSNVVLPNTPLADPQMALRLAGRNIALTVAGNRFFNPFVWERPYVFSVEYDSQGRAQRAHQLPEAGPSARPPVVAEFSWDGFRLSEIRVFQPTEGVSSPPLIYQRRLRYEQGRLVGEEIRAGAKSSSIKYKWNAGQLVSAECEKDETLDGRSRDVFFASPARTRSNL